MPTEKEKMLAGELYRPWDMQLTAERNAAHAACTDYNRDLDIDRLKTLLGTCPAELTVEPFFRCDYGFNIHLGENFYSNHDLIILDVCEVRIGDRCLIAPRVTITTARHPLDVAQRRDALEDGAPITIGDDCWIGAHAVINPGVTLGDRVVVGSGAVVTKSFPSDVVIAGVPAKIIRHLEPSELES